MFNAIGNFFAGVWSLITAVLGFIVDPTGHVGLNIVVWLIVYAAGWYAASMGFAMVQIDSQETSTTERCSLQANLSEYHCTSQHPSDCWREQSVPLSDHKKRELVVQCMGWATLWPIVLAAVVLFAPIILVAWVAWLAIIRPATKGAMVVGDGIMAGTVAVATHSVDYIVQRANDIEQHKALTSSSKSADEEKVKARALDA